MLFYNKSDMYFAGPVGSVLTGILGVWKDGYIFKICIICSLKPLNYTSWKQWKKMFFPNVAAPTKIINFVIVPIVLFNQRMT